MLFEKTNCIDIPKLEHESRILFIFGYVIGILFVASLSPFISLRTDSYPSAAGVEKPDWRKPIRIDLIYVQPQEEIAAVQIIEPEIIEVPAVEPETVGDIPPDAFEETAPEKEVISLLRQPEKPVRFPDLSGTKNIPRHEISEPETIRMPERWGIRTEPEPEPTVTIPVEKVRDKRREFKSDFFGIPLGGIPSTPIHFVRNAPNQIKWKIRDIMKKRRIKKLVKDKFSAVSEKDVRLMILVWRDGLLDTRKISIRDREFISAAQKSDNEIMSHQAYLLGMEKRGLVSSLVTGENLVFRANFSRDSILETLAFERMNSENSDSINSLNTLIGLIRAHGDSVKTEITMPPENILYLQDLRSIYEEFIP